MIREKVTYILGAGFSAMAGLPVMSNFIEKAKDIYFSPNNEKYGYFKKIFDKINELSIIKNYFNTDLFNIEELLSILDMENNLGEKENNTDIVKFIIDVINFYSENKISVKYQNKEHMNLWDCVFGKTDIQRNIIAFVSSLFKLTYNFSGTMPRVFSSNHCYSVISLNYDTLLETAIASISRIFNPEHKFEKKDYVEDWSNPMLFKIHGDIETSRIIPPTWAKSINKDMQKIWKNAFELLKNSNQIRFMGYSLPVSDTYFQYFLKAAIKNNPHLKNIDIICLDNDHSVEKRYGNLFSFKNLRFKNINISDYCSKLWEQNIDINNKLEYTHTESMR